MISSRPVISSPTRVDPERINIIRDGAISGPVIYWMNREQRVADNWSLVHAADCAREARQPLIVVFCFGQRLERTERQVIFMERAMGEMRNRLADLSITLLISPRPARVKIPELCVSVNAGLVVTDFFPLREYRAELKTVTESIAVPVHSVDAHNIVPCRFASGKEEVGARTLRPKINRVLGRFLTEFPVIERHPFVIPSSILPEDENMREYLEGLDRTSGELSWIPAGESAGWDALQKFLVRKLSRYDEDRNNPVLQGQSDLSPYLHFGMISAQRVALEVGKCSLPAESKAAFLEELIVRRELSDNFCLYNRNYDSIDGFSRWAQNSLKEHCIDEREKIYSEVEFERAKTGDPLWNAAQKQLLRTGKIHGYMRMYWAKKILEWSPDPASALRVAQRLNDKYSLDGNDPNGFTGVAWSIGGIHDRAWFNRPVYGKIRYMNSNGAASKFDVGAYISQMEEI